LYVIHLLLAVEGGEASLVFLALFICQVPGEHFEPQRVSITVALIVCEEEALVA
jgi:hypothetical protein